MLNFGNGMEAVKYGTKACELTDWKYPPSLGTLAAAYAEAGDFDQAVRLQKKRIESDPKRSDIDEARQHLKLYEQQKPFHEAK